MKISYTDDGYLKADFKQEEKLNYENLQQMNKLPYFVPSLKNRFEENSILYHLGEYVSISQFVQDKIYDLQTYKQFVLSIFNALLQIEQEQFKIENTLLSVEYIFIHAKDQTIRFVYLPTEKVEKTKVNVIHELISQILSGIKTKGAASLLGELLELSGNDRIEIAEIIKDIENVDKTTTTTQEKERIVEKVVEVPVEKIVYVNKSSNLYVGITVGTEVIGGILIPSLIAYLKDMETAGIVAIGLAGSLAIAYAIIGIILGKEKVAQDARTTRVVDDNNILANNNSVQQTNVSKSNPAFNCNSNNHANVNRLQNNQADMSFNTMQNNQADIKANMVQSNQTKANIVKNDHANAKFNKKANNKPDAKFSKKANNQTKAIFDMEQNNNARVSRNNPLIQNNAQKMSKSKTLEEQNNMYKLSPQKESTNDNNVYLDDTAEEGTVVLGNSSDVICAYMIAEGRKGLMDRIFIDKKEFVIGREQNADYRVEDGTVSKRHAKFTNNNGIFYLEDLGARNGTTVDGERITTKIQLQDGNKIKFGNKTYIFHIY